MDVLFLFILIVAHQWRIQKIWWENDKIINTKPKNIGGVIPGMKPEIRNGAAVLGVRSADPPALKNFAFFCKNNLSLELV